MHPALRRPCDYKVQDQSRSRLQPHCSWEVAASRIALRIKNFQMNILQIFKWSQQTQPADAQFRRSNTVKDF
jgi:hypothetical protein